jgi:hypothetical protein
MSLKGILKTGDLILSIRISDNEVKMSLSSGNENSIGRGSD